LYPLSTANPNDRRHAVLAVVLVFLGSARIASTYSVFSHTMDEPDHLGAGMQYLSTGVYTYEPAHTPLARVLAAAGPFLAGERFRNVPILYTESFRILGSGQHYQRILTLGRLGILPFFWVASAVVFLWGKRCAGPLAALIATLLFTTLPPVLAHSGLITTDIALTAMVAAAAYAGVLWAEKPSRGRTIALGLTVALALVSKLSAIPYLAAAWFLMYAWHLYWERPGLGGAAYVVECGREIRRRWLSAAAALGVAALTIWAVYSFHFGPVDYLHSRLPAPEFFEGLAEVWKHNRDGHASYLLGQRRHIGVWYFFPVTLAVKTPLAMLLMLLWTPWLWRRMRGLANIATAVAFPAGILLFAMTSRINIGVRHVLPVYVGFAIVCGAAAACVLQGPSVWKNQAGRPVQLTMLALLVWHVASGAWQHPDYLPYTNEIAGNHPENFVGDSDLDWGQDMKRLGEYFARIGVSEITFKPYNITYVTMGGPPLPRMLPDAWDHPSPGWNAVSLSQWKVFNHPGWIDGRKPQVRIGRTTWLWYFP
jgi:hypothetical protein